HHRVEDSLYAGLVTGGFLLCPVHGLAAQCHPWLLAVATELLVGGVGARFFRHGMLLSVRCTRVPAYSFLLRRGEFHDYHGAVASAPLSTGVTSPLAVGSCGDSRQHSGPDLSRSHRHTQTPAGRVADC